MDVGRFQEDIVHIWQQESSLSGVANEAELHQDPTAQRVAQKVFDKLVHEDDAGMKIKSLPAETPSQTKLPQEAEVQMVVQKVFEMGVRYAGEKTETSPSSTESPPQGVFAVLKNCQAIMRGDLPESLKGEISNLCAKQNIMGIIKFIKDFGITDQRVLTEIAKQYAKKDAGATAQNIYEFRIEKQSDLVEIAKLCMQQNLWATMENIRYFGIKKQSDLVEILKLGAQQDGWGTAVNIPRFRIEDQSGLIEIAKLCAQQNAGRTAENITNFGIDSQSPEGQSGLIEIAKLCAQQNGRAVATHIGSFGINDPKALLEICVYSFVNSPIDFKNKIKIQDYFARLPDAVLEGLKDLYSESQLEHIQQELGASWKCKIPSDRGGINKEMLVSLFFVCKVLNKMDALKSDRIAELTQALLDFKDPSLKPVLLQLLVEVIAHDRLSKFEAFIKDIKIPTKTQHKPLALLSVLTIFGMQDLDQDFKKKIVTSYLKKLGTRSSFLAQAPKTAAFIEFVGILNDRIPKERQAEVYEQFLSYDDSKTFSRKLFVLRAAVGCGLGIVGKNFEEVRAQLCQQIPVQKEKQKGFEEIFGKLRRPESLFVYFGGIKELSTTNRTQVEATLATYLQEVVDGTFTERRYALSPQLSKMRQLYGKEKWEPLLAKWKQKTSFTIEELSQSELPAQQAVNVKEIFVQKRADGHFPKDKMPLLCAVLDGTMQDETQIEKVLQSKDKSLSEQKFDALCACLAQAERLDLQLIQKALECAPQEWEIRNDLKNLLELTKSPLDTFKGYTVENTDDHWDLFLCGTEVTGSCQRVDGNPALNKDLLGYVVDGKIRMIAIKDAHGRIVARSIVKLLWDDTEKKPVLFIERVYSNNVALNPIIGRIAQKEAERLGVELVFIESAQKRHFQSYPNRSGFEYEDGGGVVELVQE